MTTEKSKVLYLYIRTGQREIIFSPVAKEMENLKEREGNPLNLSSLDTWEALLPKG
ncbi:MAG TPA: hypothetical protein PK104_08575 [Spirochaetota bacterium]|jgi:hypothetical protein|nr:hypothetical protein [Spirochaetota bacterium]